VEGVGECGVMVEEGGVMVEEGVARVEEGFPGVGMGGVMVEKGVAALEEGDVTVLLGGRAVAAAHPLPRRRKAPTIRKMPARFQIIAPFGSFLSHSVASLSSLACYLHYHKGVVFLLYSPVFFIVNLFITRMRKPKQPGRAYAIF
jgi:hypothetical protein